MEDKEREKRKLPEWVPCGKIENADEVAAEQYSKLTEENKKKVIQYIENLKAEQCTPEFCACFPQ